MGSPCFLGTPRSEHVLLCSGVTWVGDERAGLTQRSGPHFHQWLVGVRALGSSCPEPGRHVGTRRGRGGQQGAEPTCASARSKPRSSKRPPSSLRAQGCAPTPGSSPGSRRGGDVRPCGGRDVSVQGIRWQGRVSGAGTDTSGHRLVSLGGAGLRDFWGASGNGAGGRLCQGLLSS